MKTIDGVPEYRGTMVSLCLFLLIGYESVIVFRMYGTS